jgi:predicted ATPase
VKDYQNWFVLTGGPSSGKSGTLRRIAERGFQIVPEPARVLIDEEMAKGKTLSTIRENETAFEFECLTLELDMEQKYSPSDTVFFDRARPDILAYLRFHQADIPEAELRLLNQVPQSQVFLLELGPVYEVDYARNESKDQASAIEELLWGTYTDLGKQPVRVPWMDTVEQRADFILQHLGL